MGLCQRYRPLIELVNELLVENLLLIRRFSKFNGTQFSLEIELMVFEDVLGRLTQLVIP